MRVAVDISLYPFNEHFIPPIKDVIERISAYDNVHVECNRLSTQIWGEYDDVMAILKQELKTTFDDEPKAIFTIKILNNPLED